MPKSLKYHLALLIANFAFGANYALYLSLIQGGLSSDTLYFIRTVSTFLFFFPAMFIMGKGKIELKDIGKILLVTALIVIGRLYFMLKAMNYTSPIDGSIIATSGPSIVLLLSVLILHQKASKWQYAGVFLGFAGAITLILSNSNSENLLSGKMLGNLLLLLSITLSSANTLFVKTLYKKYSPLTVVGWAYALGMFFVIPCFADDFLNTDFAALSQKTWWSLAFMCIIGTILATGLLYYALSGLSPTLTTVYTYIQPIVATGLAIFMGQDKLTATTIAAALLIFASLICMEKNKL